MVFYNKRSIYEQANRLPLHLQEKYLKTQLDRIEIDGQTIQGYFEYSFMEEKSYVEQPTRASDGSISDLDSYTTFLTPRLIIRYNMMEIEDYRKLMKLLKSKNAFMVTCYDIVEDKRVTHEMYFATPSMPIIYQQYLTALGVQEYTIELIGTNNNKTHVIKQYFNFPRDAEISVEFPNEKQYFESEVPSNVSLLIGDFLIGDGNIQDCSSNYYITSWNTKQDGSGVYFHNRNAYYFSENTDLYAQWSRR